MGEGYESEKSKGGVGGKGDRKLICMYEKSKSMEVDGSCTERRRGEKRVKSTRMERPFIFLCCV